jgi:adenosylcobalamin-dependent ribonucleoside-diphosphate reductase
MQPKENLQERKVNALAELGEKIFLDRYAIKDAKKETLAVGDTVVVCVNLKTGQREIGTVEKVNLDNREVIVKLRDGSMETRAIEHIDKPLETVPEQMFERIAQHIASVEPTAELQTEWQGRFRELMNDWKYVPAGRIFTGAGTGQNLTYYNCYVIPSPKDSRGGIFETLGQMAEIMSRGGGVGINVSTLRPRYAYVKGVNGRSSGAVSWASLYSFVTGLIEQGGCFGPDERVLTNIGLIPAQELAERIERGERIQAQTHRGLRPITARFRNGIKSLYEVTTHRGYRVRVTQEHKMAVLRDGKIATVPLADLSEGDEILLLLGEGLKKEYIPLKPVNYQRSKMSTTLNENVKLPEVLNEDLAYLIGYMHGDGYVQIGRKVNWSAPKAIKMATADDYPEIRQRIIDAARNLFGLEPTIEDGDGKVKNVSLYSRLLVEWLITNGLLKSHANKIRVPEAIFRSDSSVMGAFIAGYFDADGCNRGQKGGYGFDSISLGMLQDVQQLLAINGIVSAISTTDRSSLGWQTIYRLTVTGAIFKQRFVDFVFTAKNSNYNGKRNMYQTYPAEVWTNLGARAKYRQRIYDGISDRISIGQMTGIRQRLAGDQQFALAEQVNELLKTLPDSIVSIKPVGESEVYDFEVDDVHLLSGAGIYTSNSRRGALMLILNVWHPDVIDFINSKKEAGKITNANISVGITDDFMKAVKEDAAWDLVFPDSSDAMYAEKWDGNLTRWKEMGGKVIKHKTVRARDIWDNIISSAWTSAEPGMYFIDRSNYYSNSHYFADLPCTNPCGEQPLPAWGVCNLGHINLAKHVDMLKKDVDWNKLKRTVQDAVRFQDNVIDATPYFFDENYKQQMSERRVGMGTIGLAEMLINLGLRYGSPQGVEFIDKLYQFISITAYETSVDLAREKGAFGKFDAEKFLQSGFMQKMPEYIRHLVRTYGIRNVTILTQAPTGTIGTMVGTSTGIEPFFSWTYYRKSRLGVHQEHIKLAKDWLDAHPGEELPDYYVTAMELTPEEHVRVQAAVQRWTDAAISKTVNAPEDYTVEQTKKLYELMYDLGCKGGTIYRDGSRDEQILATDHKKLGKDASDQVAAQLMGRASLSETERETKMNMNAQATPDTPTPTPAPEPTPAPTPAPAPHPQSPAQPQMSKTAPRKRPDVMHGSTYKVNTAYGNLYVTINEDEYGPFEVFSQLGKAGGFFGAQTEAICRMISLALRSGISLQNVIDQLKGIRGPDPVFHNGERILSLPDAIANVLENHLKRGQQVLQLEIPKIETPKIEKRATPTLSGRVSTAEDGREPVFSALTQEIHSTTTEYVTTKKSVADVGDAPICMVCGEMLRMAEGCMKCEACGWSKC